MIARSWPLLLIVILPLLLVLIIAMSAARGAEGLILQDGTVITCPVIRRMVQELSEEERAQYAAHLTPEQLKAIKRCLGK